MVWGTDPGSLHQIIWPNLTAPGKGSIHLSLCLHWVGVAAPQPLLPPWK